MRAVSKTRIGYRVKLVLRRSLGLLPRYSERSRTAVRTTPHAGSRGSRNVLLVSHGDFSTNSGRHVHAIASELVAQGYSPSVALPGRHFGLAEVGPTSFPVVTHRDVIARRLRLSRGGLDLVHAFTPRAAVRRVTLGAAHEAGCEYVVHLEDDDAGILGGTTAEDRQAFLSGSAGVSVVTERLLELKPERSPGVVIWPGFDDSVLTPGRGKTEVRRSLGVDVTDVVLVYNGNIQETNLDAMRELYLAVALLRQQGVPAVLVKTGWNFVPDARLPRLGEFIRDLGWVARSHIPDLLHAADVLVQPGRPGGFDDYRFPSKLPEFLASGTPVVLPRTNIGLHLRDGLDALLLDQGDAQEIAGKAALLADDSELARTIGDAGREFALRELRWSASVEGLSGFYEAVLGAPMNVPSP